MGDRDDGARVLLQVLLEPEHALGVEVVGGLVEQQQIRLLQEQLGQRDPALLTAGEILDTRVARGRAQGIHRLLQLRVEIPGVGRVDLGLQFAHLGEQGVEVGIRIGHRRRDLVEAVELGLDRADALLHVLEHGLALVEHRLLHQDAHRVSRAELGLAIAGDVEPGHDLQDGGLARAVRADHSDLRPRQERHGHIVEDELLADRFAGAHHRINEFGHGVSLRIALAGHLTAGGAGYQSIVRVVPIRQRPVDSSFCAVLA